MPDTRRKASSPAAPDQHRDAKLADPASRNIAAIASLEREALHERTRLDRKDTDIHELASALDRVLAEKAANAPASTPALHTPSPHRS